MGMSPRLLRPRATAGRFSLLRQSLVAYWPLNEDAASGDVTAVDWTRRGNDLTSNNTVPSVAGKVNNARQFTPANSEYLSRASNTDLQFGDGNWTISAWIYPQRSTTGFEHVVGKDQSGGREGSMRFQFNSGTTANGLTFSLFHTDGTEVTLNVQNKTNANFINKWWNYVVVHNSGVVTAYENGASGGTVNRGGGKAFAATSTEFNVGRRSFAGFLEHFNGYIDEVAKWTRALTATEVSQLYNSGNGIDLRQ
jgi:hypothetical protein